MPSCDFLERCLVDVEKSLVKLLDAFIMSDVSPLFGDLKDSEAQEGDRTVLLSHMRKVSYIDQMLRRVRLRYEDIRDRPDRVMKYRRRPDGQKVTDVIAQYALSPISCLPRNAISAIFDLAVFIPSRMDRRARRDPARLMSLTHVCRDWRLAALETRRFWDVIRLEWPTEQQDDWIKRCNGAKIHLVADCLREVTISQRVLDYSSRWLSVTAENVSDKNTPLFRSTFCAPQQDLPSLEYCYLSGNRHNSHPIPFTVCPIQFHTLRIKCLGHIDAGRYLFNLRHLYLKDCSFAFEMWIDVLNKCVCLESLVILSPSFGNKSNKVYLREKGRKNAPTINIVLGRLKALEIGARSDEHRTFLDFIFSSFHTPVLQELHVDCSQFYDLEPYRLFNDAADFFKKCSFLSHLSFQGDPDISSHILKILCENEEKLLGLRHLKSFSLGAFMPGGAVCGNPYHSTVEKFITMLEKNPFSTSSKPVGRLFISHCPSDRREWYEARATELCAAPIVKPITFDPDEDDYY